jgi:hypothetical protein
MQDTTAQLLADLAAVTARFEALAQRTGENAQAFIEGLKDDKKNLENMKKVLA